MEIRKLNAEQLSTFIQSEAYKNLPFLPITALRAISQCANPRMDKEDILLFIAEENSEMLGYCGMLPDRMYIKEQVHKMAWISGLWVNPELRGRGVGTSLIKTALETWNNTMWVTEFIPDTKKLYTTLYEFQDLPPLKGLIIYHLAKWNKLVLLKFPKLKPLSLLLKTMSYLSRPIFNRLSKSENLSFYSTHEINPEMSSFIERNNKNELFRRNSSDLNWLSHYPWMKQMSELDDIAKGYYFSYQATIFHQEWITVKDKQSHTIIACFMLSQRDFNLKIPYFYLEEASYISAIAEWIFAKMQMLDTCILTTFQPELVNYFQAHPTFNRRIKSTSRPYMLPKSINLSDIEKLRIQDGDGDCVFT